MEQLLWLETLIKGVIGISLLLSPKMVIRAFALPESNASFWPRLVGALLVGLATIIFISGAKLSTHGIGAVGLATLNLSAAAVLFATYLTSGPATRRRGKTLLGFLALILCLLAIGEILLR